MTTNGGSIRPEGDDGAGSMDEVAALAGVSQSTVSRTLRGAPGVRPETRERVRAAALQLGFVPSKAAASLATGRAQRIAVLVGSPLVEWFSGCVLDALYPVLSAAGYDTVLYRVHDAHERTRFFDTLPATRNADALIVASFALSDEEHATLRAMRMPIVYLNQAHADQTSVGIDDVQGARTAMRHLLRLGHTRIAYARHRAMPGFQWSASSRIEGYRQELADAGLPVDPQLLLVADGGPGFGPAIIGSLLGLPDMPTAIFAENDDIAVRIMHAAHVAGLRCPDDFSIIGFDDQTVAEVYGLTTVAQPAAELAALAARLAIEAAEDRDTKPEAIELPTRIVVRSSTRRHEPVAGR